MTDLNTTTEQPPRALHRWLGAVPMFVTFFIAFGMVPFMQRMRHILKLFNVDLPLPTHIALYWAEFSSHFYLLWLPLMFGPSWLYFSWGSRSSRRLMWWN